MSNYYGSRSSGGAEAAARPRTPQTPRSASTTSSDSSAPGRRGRPGRRSARRPRNSFHTGDYGDNLAGDGDDRPSLSDHDRGSDRMAREDERGHGYSDALLDEADTLVEFPVPAWSQGSRLTERRILYTVDTQTEGIEVGDITANSSVSVSRSTAATSHGAPHPRYPAPAGAPPLVPLPATDASPLLLRPRMQEAATPADPRTRLLDLVITNTTASITLAAMEAAMDWNARYAGMYGPLLEYLQSYQSIFVVSPVDDRVRLRRMFSVRTDAFTRASRQSPKRTAPLAAPLSTRQRGGRRTGRESAALRSQSSVDRRTGKPSLPSAEALAAHIGSISYSCVAERFDLDALETVYHRRGYTTATVHDVLHVSSENCFDLFLFPSGAVVWWGMDRQDHWMVDDEFLSATNHLTEGVGHRYNQGEIDALFPIWCSYELDEQYEEVPAPPSSPHNFQPVEVEPALERLAKVLCFDHYLVPAYEPARSLVMLTFSHSLGRSARVDYFEFLTKWSHRHILSIPAEFSGLLDYFSTKRRVTKLEGEIAVAQLAIQTIHDTPEVLWNVSWLQGYYDMAEQQNTAESRLSWFTSRSDTLLEQLSHIKGRRHRLFMLGSDVFLIVLLILDVMFMTSRLVAKMYFKVAEED